MKTVNRILQLLLILLLAAVAFFFWGKSPTWEETAYASISEVKVPPRPQTLSDSVFKVVTYNIGYLSGMTNNLPEARDKALVEGNAQKALRAFVLENSVHLIALQEADFEAERSFNIDQAQLLAATCETPYVARAVNWDKRYVPFPYWPPSMHFGRVVSGQAILSVYPIKAHERKVLEMPPNNPFYYNAFYIDRLLQTATIDWQGREVTVMNVHLEAWDYDTRQRQSAYVLEAMQAYAAKGPVILLGDFNSAPAADATVQMFVDAPGIASAFPTESFNLPESCTYPADVPDVHIDHIFYTSRDFESLEWHRMDEAGTASDHLPVVWSFKWNTSPL